MLEGRAPNADDEVALGQGTLDRLDKEVGDTVEIRGSDGSSFTATVVGAVVAPATISTAMDLDSGGVLTFDAARRRSATSRARSSLSASWSTFAAGTDRKTPSSGSGRTSPALSSARCSPST